MDVWMDPSTVHIRLNDDVMEASLFTAVQIHWDGGNNRRPLHYIRYTEGGGRAERVRGMMEHFRFRSLYSGWYTLLTATENHRFVVMQSCGYVMYMKVQA